MEHWVEAAAVGDLTDHPVVPYEYNGTSLIIVRVDDDFYALENLCTHDYTPLDDGTVEGDEVVCAHHGARFCARTGAVTAPPAYEDLRTFPVKVESGRVMICVDTLER